MDAQIKESLPAPLQGLVDEIETAGGHEIAVQHAPDLGAVPMLTNLHWEGCDLKVTIKYRDEIDSVVPAGPVPYSVFGHELLHLRRYLVDRVPMFGRIHDASWQAIDIESMLEHLVVESQLKNYGFDFPISLSSREHWNNIPSKDLEQARRYVVMDAWTRIQFLTEDPAERAAMEAFAAPIVKQQGLIPEAEYLTDELRWLLASPDPVKAKEAMSLVMCRVCCILPDLIKLAQYTDGAMVQREIPHRIEVPSATGEVYFFEWNVKRVPNPIKK
jgi:hypothetical protein